MRSSKSLYTNNKKIEVLGISLRRLFEWVHLSSRQGSKEISIWPHLFYCYFGKCRDVFSGGFYDFWSLSPVASRVCSRLHQSAGWLCRAVKGGCAHKSHRNSCKTVQFSLYWLRFILRIMDFMWYFSLVHHMVHCIHRILGEYSLKIMGVWSDLG